MKPYIAAAYNMDIGCIERYKEYGVDEIWASINFPSATFGSGRIFFKEDNEMVYEELGKHFTQARKLGLKTSFLFNPPCTGNQEFSAAGMQEIINMAKFINRFKVDFITICQPFLITAFRKLCPDVKIKISSHYNCNNIGKFEFLLDTMDFDIVIVSQFANKNFKLLREVTGRWDPDRLEVMCTFPCIANCPYRLWHSQFVAHGNVLPDEEHVPKEIYPCTFDIIHNPAIAMSAMFIRKEDMKFYRELGIHRFKIGERKDSTKNNLYTVQYYLDKMEPDFVPPSLFRRFLGSIYEEIDLRAMDGFYEKFVNGDCDGMKFNCSDCDHCLEYAKKVFKYKKDINIGTIPDNKEFFNTLFLKKYIKKLESMIS
jgi:collagenase-like PrtC family protease